ncbi:MAG TPA: GFA family protein [Acetobacteraceae bacterium]|nr:GFA family protein [Acetobacteraceae bacterium]
MTKTPSEKLHRPAATAAGQCVCGAVRLEIDFPAFWAWHDHSRATQLAHGAAYATYIGVWKSRVRVTLGNNRIVRFKDKARQTTRSFCATCGTPLLYERPRSAKMVNLPRALFETRTGREPRYHIALAESPEWAYRGEALGPLKGFPGVLWARPRMKRPAAKASRR